MPIVSIIVPVYNAERYIRRCLDSILSQTFTDWECILVDDASKDGVRNIISDYQQNDSRFIVVNKQVNGGVSRARQTGLEKACGTYVIHADPDDWVASDWLETLYNEAVKTSADMVICDFERIYTNKKVHYCQKPTSLNNEDILVDMVDQKIWGACWNKLIRRKCFEDYHVQFHPDMNLWEDLYVTCRLVLNGIKVAYVPKVLYHYDSVSNENSIVMYRNDSHIQSVMIFVDTYSPILSSKRFEDGWYHVKSKIKFWIFSIPNSRYNIQKTYSEINERFIHDSQSNPIWSQDYCIALCLKGYTKAGHLLYKYSNLFISILSKWKLLLFRLSFLFII